MGVSEVSQRGAAGFNLRDLSIVDSNAQGLLPPSQSILPGLWDISHGVFGKVEPEDFGLGGGRRDIEYDARQGREAE